MPNKVLARKRAGRPPANKSTEPSSSNPAEAPSKRLKRSNSKPVNYFPGNQNPGFSSDEESEKFGSKKYGCPRSSILKATCKPQTFNGFFKEKLETKLRPTHWELISETPFCHFFDLPGKWVVSNAVLHLLLECWNPEKDAFIFKGNKLKFTSKEVGIVLGLKHAGSLVSETNAKQKGISEINAKYFGNRRHISRQEIEKSLLELVDSEQNSTDFVKVLVLYLFAMILFPLTQNKIDAYLCQYVDSIENLKNYSWAGAIHQQLEPQITSQSNWVCGRGEGQTYLKGCSLALQVWFYEHIDQAKLRVGLELIPRMFNWNLAEQHQRSGSFMKMLNRIPKGKVNEEALVPTDEEQIILKEGLFSSTLAQSIKSVSQSAPPQLAIAVSSIPLTNLICNSKSQIEEERIAQIEGVTVAVSSEIIIGGVKQEDGIAENLTECEKEGRIVENCRELIGANLSDNGVREEGIVGNLREDGIVEYDNPKENIEGKFISDNVQIEEIIVHNLCANADETDINLKENVENFEEKETEKCMVDDFIDGANEIIDEKGEKKEEELKDMQIETNEKMKENIVKIEGKEISRCSIDDFISGDNERIDEEREETESEFKDLQNEEEIVEKLSENVELSHENSKENVGKIEGEESANCMIDDFMIDKEGMKDVKNEEEMLENLSENTKESHGKIAKSEIDDFIIGDTEINYEKMLK